ASYYLGEYDEAIEAENYVLNIEPHCAEGWWVKGMSLRDLQNSKPFTEDEEAVYQQAIDCFDKAIAIKPSREIFWKEKMDTCACLIDDPQVKYKKNVELCTEYLSINPFLEVMWVLKCDSFLMANLDLGDMALGKEGLAVVEEGLKFLPKSSILWKYKSDALQRMGKFREASNALDTAIDLYDPKGLVDSPKSGLLVQKSNCLKRGGYYKEAKEAYDQAEEIVFRAAIPSDAPEYFIELFIKSLHDYQKSGKRENYENKKKAKPLPDNDLRQAIKNRSAQLGDGKPWPHPGKLIKEVFEKKDLTVYGAAQIMKVDRHFLRSIVRCERSINNEIAEKFAAHFSEWTEDDLLWVQLKHGQFQYKQLAPALEPTPAG
ncbi:MAG: hypothetical protein KC643_22720, partial [Nitrospira sp.]|nr:hypothetical protein [Nitrospira sp.]